MALHQLYSASKKGACASEGQLLLRMRPEKCVLPSLSKNSDGYATFLVCDMT